MAVKRPESEKYLVVRERKRLFVIATGVLALTALVAVGLNYRIEGTLPITSSSHL